MFIKQRHHLCDRFLKLYLHHRVIHASVCVCSYMGMCDRTGAFYANIYNCICQHMHVCIHEYVYNCDKFYPIFITMK